MDERSATDEATEETADTARPALPPLGRSTLAAGGFAGLTYWICGSFSFPEGPPMATATAEQVRDHAATQGAAIQTSAFAGMIGLVAALIFLAALVRQVRDRLPGSMHAEVVLGAGLLVVIYQWLVVTAEAVPRLLPNLVGSDLASTDDAILQGWYGLTGFVHFMGDLAVVPMVVLMASFCLAALRGGLLPRWLSWVGLVLVGTGVLGMVGIIVEVDVLYPFWFVGLFGYFFWILAVSITFLVRLRRSRPVASN